MSQSRPKIYLHIGNYKTGTSAIQRFCSSHRAELLDQGVHYLQSATQGGDGKSHAAFPLSLYKKYGAFTPPWYTGTNTFEEISESIQSEITSCRSEKVLISSEELFRITTMSPEKIESAKGDIKRLFEGFDVKVISYIREPMSFAKSWYNEVNKAPYPCGRFSDFIFYLDIPLICPNLTVKFWRESFGEHALILRPYLGARSDHIASFLSTLDIRAGFEPSPADFLVNPGRDEKSLEEDRLAKIYALDSPKQRDAFLQSHALGSVESFNRLDEKIKNISQLFDTFCEQEGFQHFRSEFTLAEVLVHEEKINRREVSSSGYWKKGYYSLLQSNAVLRLRQKLKAARNWLS